MANDLGHKIKSDRGHIDSSNRDDMRVWARHLGVSITDLERAIAKVGNAVPAVRKELGK